MHAAERVVAEGIAHLAAHTRQPLIHDVQAKPQASCEDKVVGPKLEEARTDGLLQPCAGAIPCDAEKHGAVLAEEKRVRGDELDVWGRRQY